MNANLTKFLVVVACTLCCGQVWAGPTITFEGLQNFEQIDSFYDGGMGSLGSGPGPNFGITFSPFALAFMRGVQSGFPNPFPGDPSPPTVLLVFNTGNPLGAGQPTSVTMDVAWGFAQGISFFDIAIGRPGLVTVYSGLDGMGTVLASLVLPITQAAFLGATTLDFGGIAESVKFTGGNDQFALDNIT